MAPRHDAPPPPSTAMSAPMPPSPLETLRNLSHSIVAMRSQFIEQFDALSSSVDKALVENDSEWKRYRSETDEAVRRAAQAAQQETEQRLEGEIVKLRIERDEALTEATRLRSRSEAAAAAAVVEESAPSSTTTSSSPSGSDGSKENRCPDNARAAFVFGDGGGVGTFDASSALIDEETRRRHHEEEFAIRREAADVIAQAKRNTGSAPFSRAGADAGAADASREAAPPPAASGGSIDDVPDVCGEPSPPPSGGGRKKKAKNKKKGVDRKPGTTAAATDAPSFALEAKDGTKPTSSPSAAAVAQHEETTPLAAALGNGDDKDDAVVATAESVPRTSLLSVGGGAVRATGVLSAVDDAGDGSNNGSDDDPLVRFLRSVSLACLRVDPTAFATFLRESEDVVSLSDLSEASEDDDYVKEVLVPNGLRSETSAAFREAVGKAAAGDDYGAAFATVEEVDASSGAAAALGGTWSCVRCTFKHDDERLVVCIMCGMPRDAGPNVIDAEDDTVLVRTNEAASSLSAASAPALAPAPAPAPAPASEKDPPKLSKKAKREAAAAKRKEKEAEVRRKASEAEKEAAEEEKRQQLLAKKEKAEAMAAHERRLKEEELRHKSKKTESCIPQDAPKGRKAESRHASPVQLDSGPVSSSKGGSSSGAMPLIQRQKGPLLAVEGMRKASLASGAAPRLKAKVFEGTRYSRYMYPLWQHGTTGTFQQSNISRIFEFIQNPKTAGKGRKLMRLEVQIGQMKSDIEALRKKRKEEEKKSKDLVEDAHILDSGDPSVNKFVKQITAVQKDAKESQEKLETKLKKERRKCEDDYKNAISAIKLKQESKLFAVEEEKAKRIAEKEFRQRFERMDAEFESERSKIKECIVERGDNQKPLSSGEQTAIRNVVEQFSQHLVPPVVQMMRDSGAVCNDDIAAPIDFDQLDTATQRKLQHFVLSHAEMKKVQRLMAEQTVKEKQQRELLEEQQHARVQELKERGPGFLARFREDVETRKMKDEVYNTCRNDMERTQATYEKKWQEIEQNLKSETQRITSLADKRRQTIEIELERRKKEIEKRLRSQEDSIDSINHAVVNGEDDIDRIRSKIKELKGNGQKEDDHFDVSSSRDERGHTLLMVAAQNNDIDTARVCFALGAKPNETSPEGFTAMFFADYFKLQQMTTLLSKHKGSIPAGGVWDSIVNASIKSTHHIDWDSTLRIAEKATVPADALLESAASLEQDSEWKMGMLTLEERKRDFTCFDSLVHDSASKSLRRVVLLEKSVYDWFDNAKNLQKSEFLCFLERLKPIGMSKEDPIVPHRRAVVGVKNPFEVLCASLRAKPERLDGESRVALFTPFVGSDVDGVSDCGALVWAVTSESKATLFKTLIEESEFRRHKVDQDERFPPHRDWVLQLGRDMHLLDLKSTSIWTSSPMELLTLDVDKGDIQRLKSSDFMPKKRIVHSEQVVRDALFRTTDSESRDNQAVLSDARTDLSTSLSGGAGTGKTLLMIKKVISEDVDKRILVISRLPRLVGQTKAAVEAERDASNVTFSMYDDLVTLLARKVEPAEEADERKFLTFSQVHFGATTGTDTTSSVSFLKDFVQDFLEPKERKSMKAALIEPITLWTALRVIKSNVKCSITKAHLSREDYMALPRAFGLDQRQRGLIYDLYLRYEDWRQAHEFKWDEADRVLYVLKHGPTVFSEASFVSWEERAFQRGEPDLTSCDDKPLAPFFFDMVFADEAQDFADLDLALFVRMSSGLRSIFFGADPAQSVELGVRMRVGTINDVFHSCLPTKATIQVKNVLQNIQMKTNHRTHAQNLEIAKAVRKILQRSFGVPGTDEHALMNGRIPEALLLQKMRDVGDEKKFRGGNIVFLAPDEHLPALKQLFVKTNVKNDVFGVREAKGLEFGSVALVGFFAHFEKLGNEEQWKNVIRWLSSAKGVSTTDSAEKIEGKRLEDCDYVLSHPEIEDQAMMLYTALTRPRDRLYFIEVEEEFKKRKGGRSGLAEFAFHHFKRLSLLKVVSVIDEGIVEMTPQQHKARGVLLVTQALDISRNFGTTESVKEKFLEAANRFKPDKGNDKHLLDQCNKHLEAILMKRKLVEFVKTEFFNKKRGEYDLEGRFGEVVKFEEDSAKFFSMCVNDSFLGEEVLEMRKLVEDVFYGTPYQAHFEEICDRLKTLEG